MMRKYFYYKAEAFVSENFKSWNRPIAEGKSQIEHVYELELSKLGNQYLSQVRLNVFPAQV